VRRLAAALFQASLLAASALQLDFRREPARGGESGSKLPHSKAAAL